MQREVPGPGQESVWDYPRPPRVEPIAERIRVEHAGIVIADTRRALRVLETSHPPTVYIPAHDVRVDQLALSDRRSFCEFKGWAHYHHLRNGERWVRDAAWSYPDPVPAFAALAGALAFYPSRVAACFWGEEQVRAQEGDFYGGWITQRVVGPFKGAQGTHGW